MSMLSNIHSFYTPQVLLLFPEYRFINFGTCSDSGTFCPRGYRFSSYTGSPTYLGIAPIFDDSEDRGPVLVAVNGLLSALILIFVAIRASTKAAILQNESWNDLAVLWVALGALALHTLVVWVRMVFTIYSNLSCFKAR